MKNKSNSPVAGNGGNQLKLLLSLLVSSLVNNPLIHRKKLEMSY